MQQKEGETKNDNRATIDAPDQKRNFLPDQRTAPPATTISGIRAHTYSFFLKHT